MRRDRGLIWIRRVSLEYDLLPLYIFPIMKAKLGCCYFVSDNDIMNALVPWWDDLYPEGIPRRR